MTLGRTLEERRRANRDAMRMWRLLYPEKVIEKNKRRNMLRGVFLQQSLERERKYYGRYRERRKIHDHRRRMSAVNLLGGKCVGCGINDPRVLEFDHIFPVSQGLLKYVPQHSRRNFRVVLAHPKDFQLLCANCHQIKSYWGEQSRP